MEFIDDKINNYSLTHTSAEGDVLKELDRHTHINILRPRMLSGHMQGRILSMISKMIGPKTILEVGTYTGYSALCLAEGLAEGGRLHTIDINEELEDVVKSYIDKAGFSEQISLHIGNALDIIPTLKLTPDLVFIDADKSNYMNYYELIINTMPSGGYIIADNVLWSGKVIEPLEENDLDTKALLEFNEHVQQDTRAENVLLPVRDGLMLIRKTQ